MWVSPEVEDLAVGAVGSSVALMEECRRIADVIHLPLDLTLAAPVWQEWPERSADSRGDLWMRYREEAYVCLCLYKACQVSIDMGCAIAFG
jgi:hypothetical protein